MYHQSFSFLDGDGDGLLRPGDVLAAVTAHEALRHHQAAAHFLEFVVATEGTVGTALAAGGGEPPLPTLHFHDYVRALRSQHGAMCRDLVVACAGVAEALRRQPLPTLPLLASGAESPAPTDTFGDFWTHSAAPPAKLKPLSRPTTPHPAPMRTHGATPRITPMADDAGAARDAASTPAQPLLTAEPHLAVDAALPPSAADAAAAAVSPRVAAVFGGVNDAHGDAAMRTIELDTARPVTEGLGPAGERTLPVRGLDAAPVLRLQPAALSAALPDLPVAPAGLAALSLTLDGVAARSHAPRAILPHPASGAPADSAHHSRPHRPVIAPVRRQVRRARRASVAPGVGAAGAATAARTLPPPAAQQLAEQLAMAAEELRSIHAMHDGGRVVGHDEPAMYTPSAASVASAAHSPPPTAWRGSRDVAAAAEGADRLALSPLLHGETAARHGGSRSGSRSSARPWGGHAGGLGDVHDSAARGTGKPPRTSDPNAFRQRRHAASGVWAYVQVRAVGVGGGGSVGQMYEYDPTGALRSWLCCTSPQCPHPPFSATAAGTPTPAASRPACHPSFRSCATRQPTGRGDWTRWRCAPSRCAPLLRIPYLARAPITHRCAAMCPCCVC
jgi:hypothetical protein